MTGRLIGIRFEPFFLAKTGLVGKHDFRRIYAELLNQQIGCLANLFRVRIAFFALANRHAVEGEHQSALLAKRADLCPLIANLIG